MANTCRWLARILSLLSVALVLALALGERAARTSLSVRELILFGLLSAGLTGNLAAWRWELAGAALALTSSLAFAGVELARHGRLPGPWLFGVMALPALLCVCSWFRRQRRAVTP